MDELARDLVEFLKTASPIVWAAFIRQAYVVAAAKLGWAISLAAGCTLLVLIGRHVERLDPDDGFFLFVYFVAVFMGIFTFGLIISALMWALNPEYYAIQLILRQLR